MIFADVTLPTLAANLALDEALLLFAHETDTFECLRLWEFPAFGVVLGAGGSVSIDVNKEACELDGVPIHRRSSGGGTVLLGPGCLLYSLVLNHRRAVELRDVNASYRWILARVRSALFGEEAINLAGTSDLAIEDLKFSGNAQQRKAQTLLHHGTILYQFELSAVAKYLNPPERMPGYRQGRSHLDFVRNISESRENIVNGLIDMFDATPGEIPEEVLTRVPSLVAEKYSQPEWNFRR